LELSFRCLLEKSILCDNRLFSFGRRRFCRFRSEIGSMSASLEPLDRDRILAGLSDMARAELTRLEVYPTLDSTNAYLMAGACAGWPGGAICLAEQQTAGRGRQGRVWLTPFGASLALSLLWRFNAPPEALSGLSLATGIAVARALRDSGVPEVGLKWPNDVWWRERKLGGILLESGGASGMFHVVAGIGLNVALSSQDAVQIDQPWVDLREILGPVPMARNRLTATLIGELIGTFVRFQECGFAGFAEEWACFDRVRDRPVRLLLPNGAVAGIARGVDTAGALLLETDNGRISPYLGGEIGLRVDP
jgi:BirA family biotin operon repressor/biotin-[acetyl-CoA-carboxylase] ligase